MTALSYRTQGR